MDQLIVVLSFVYKSYRFSIIISVINALLRLVQKYSQMNFPLHFIIYIIMKFHYEIEHVYIYIYNI